MRYSEFAEDATPLKLRFEVDPILPDPEDRHQDAKMAQITAYVGDALAGSMKIGPSRDHYGDFGSKAYSVMNVFVTPQFRRMGIATALYNRAYRLGFKPIKPDTKLMPDGEKFWDAHQRSKTKLGKPIPKREWKPSATRRR